MRVLFSHTATERRTMHAQPKINRPLTEFARTPRAPAVVKSITQVCWHRGAKILRWPQRNLLLQDGHYLLKSTGEKTFSAFLSVSQPDLLLPRPGPFTHFWLENLLVELRHLMSATADILIVNLALAGWYLYCMSNGNGYAPVQILTA